MISISGVRGVYGDGLDSRLAERFGFAFGTLYRGSVVLGRDSRVSGQSVAAAVMAGIRKAGADVIDLGLASTPTTEMAVQARGASGGIIITASHNPAEWNGLKFLGPDGVFLDASQAAELIGVYESAGDLADKPLSGGYSRWDGANDFHIDKVLGLDFIEPKAIAARHFSVALDPVNGAGGIIGVLMLRRLGCRVFGINLEPTGAFAHNPEPLPANLTGLSHQVSETRADVGFAVDPDVDRLAIVDECGTVIGEEYTLAFAVDYMLGKAVSDTVCNLSTSRMVDDSAAKYGSTVHRSAIGEINVVTMMRETGAKIGGEGNGGVILPALHYGRDAVLGMALILQMMTERNASIGELAGRIPSYVMVKEKADLVEKGSWRASVRAAFAGETIDERDGLKIVYPDSWVHIRESNTEPIVRLYAEAPDERKARALIDKVRGVL